MRTTIRPSSHQRPNRRLGIAATAVAAAATLGIAQASVASAISPSPLSTAPGAALQVSAQLQELPVPPTVPTNGPCANPTGCVSAAWGALASPGFYPDAHYVLLGAQLIPDGGTTAAAQVLLVKTDGSTFADGDGWKCITCGLPMPAGAKMSAYPPPYGYRDGRVLVGNSMLLPNSASVASDGYDPTQSTVYPIYWAGIPLGSSDASHPSFLDGAGREWRANPDGVHLGWSDYAPAGDGGLDEFGFYGTLTRNDAAHRYDLTSVSALINNDPAHLPYTVDAHNQLHFNPVAMVGELRGFTSDGTGTLGLQSYESDSVDAWTASLATGASRPLTNHAEYTDPMFMSPNGKWMIAEEVLGSGRLDFISGLEGVPPVLDQLPTTGFVSGIRNASQRRYFLPWLVNIDRGQSEQINAGSDPSWNAAADPTWLADSTGVVWDENYACAANTPVSSSCVSGEPGGRYSRVMLATFPNLTPSALSPVPTAPDTIPWGTPYSGNDPLHITGFNAAGPVFSGDPTLPTRPHLASGTYTLAGASHGSATVTIVATAKHITSISAAYSHFADTPRISIDGAESVTLNSNGSITFHENLTSTGEQKGTKVTNEPDGFTLEPSVLSNHFQAVGTLTTTINGQAYVQPANGA